MKPASKIVGALLAAGTLGVTGVPTSIPAQAASTSVSIAGASVRAAPDTSTKGAVRTPTVSTSGNVAVTSREYVVRKGKSIVARSSAEESWRSLKVGTYKITTTVKYKTYTDKQSIVPTRVKKSETYVKGYEKVQTSEAHLADWKPVTKDFPWRNLDSCKRIGDATYDNYYEWHPDWYRGDWGMDLPIECVNAAGDHYRLTADISGFGRGGGQVEAVHAAMPIDMWIDTILDDGQNVVRFVGMPESAKIFAWVVDDQMWREFVPAQYDDVAQYGTRDVWVTVNRKVTTRTWSSSKTSSRTQTVKVANSGVMTLREYKRVKNKMTLSQVRAVVGGTGKVVCRWSYDKDDYRTHEFAGSHYVEFRNGKVYAKSWS